MSRASCNSGNFHDLAFPSDGDVRAIDPVLKLGRLVAGMVELPVPDPPLVKRPVIRNLQNAERRLRVLPQLEILRKGSKPGFVIGARDGGLLSRGFVASPCPGHDREPDAHLPVLDGVLQIIISDGCLPAMRDSRMPGPVYQVSVSSGALPSTNVL